MVCRRSVTRADVKEETPSTLLPLQQERPLHAVFQALALNRYRQVRKAVGLLGKMSEGDGDARILVANAQVSIRKGIH